MTAVVYRLRRANGRTDRQVKRQRELDRLLPASAPAGWAATANPALAWLVWRDPTLRMAVMKLFNSPWGRSIADYIAIV